MRQPKASVGYLGIAYCSMLLWCFNLSSAQVDPSRLFSAASDRATTTNFYFAQANELTIVVNIMGFVQRPGRYEISTSIDLVNLIALAGGPTADGTLGNVMIRRMTQKGDVTWYSEYVVDLTNVIALNQAGESTRQAALALRPGDVVTVGRSSWSTVRDVSGIIVSAALLTATVVQLLNTPNRGQ